MWVWDGARANERRRAVFPDYKRGRPPQPEDIRASAGLLRRLLPFTPAWQAFAPGYEADDVIAHLASRLPPPVAIVSTDFDFYQLHDPPHVFGGSTVKDGVRPDQVRLYKALVGDPRDNVPGVPGFGPKTWATCDREALACLVENPARKPGPLEVPRRVQDWLEDFKNRVLVRTMWEVVGFLPVPEEEIRIERGTPAPAVVEHVFKELLI